jgi:NAD(P)-dependent dehydrogenase (short-subunit alcohol dehydrogenase family)
VALLARGAEGLRGAEAEVRSVGSQALAIPTDVAEFDEVAHAAERMEAELGPIDGWVNNVRATDFGPFAQVSSDEFRRATAVTFLGTVHGTWVARHHMAPRRRGCIVPVGSALAYRSIPLQSAYCGSRHALRGFTNSLRSELDRDRLPVHLTTVQMPARNTPQFSWCRNRLSRHLVPPLRTPSRRSVPRRSSGPPAIAGGRSSSGGRRAGSSGATGSLRVSSTGTSVGAATGARRARNRSPRTGPTTGSHRSVGTSGPRAASMPSLGFARVVGRSGVLRHPPVGSAPDSACGPARAPLASRRRRRPGWVAPPAAPEDHSLGREAPFEGPRPCARPAGRPRTRSVPGS